MPPAEVLIVEDESIIAEDLRHSLNHLGYQVSGVATTGEEAVEKAAQAHPDVVLMDIMLKGAIDGVDAANKIRSLGIPVVYLTAHADDQTFHRAKLTEPYAYIIKPYEERELQIAVEMAIYKYKSEGQLRRMEQWLTTTLKSIGDGVIATDVEGTITFVNRVAEYLTGSNAQAALGKNLFEVLRIVDEETHETVRPASLLDGASPHWKRQPLLIRKDGKEIPIGASIAPIRDESGAETGRVLVLRDISEQKKSEIRLRGQLREAEVKYRTLVEQIPAVSYIAASGTILYVSPQIEPMLGFSQREWLERPEYWYELIHPDDATRVKSERVRAFHGERMESDYRIFNKDKNSIWVRDEAFLVRDEAGNPMFLQGMLLDITDQKRAEIQLKNSHEQLRALSARLEAIREEERTRISREIHDELGQVLTALKMDLSLLNQNLMDASASLPRRRLLEEVKSISSLVDRAIKTVRKIATELRPEVLDHLGLRSAIEWQTQEFQSRTGIECRLNSNFEAIDVSLDCATAVFRIFQETLTNVARHANASSVDIRLEKDGPSLLLQVQDNGKGINESDIYNGTSLGLLGMRERTLLLGGEIQIQGQPGRGTTVDVKIPIPHTEHQLEE